MHPTNRNPETQRKAQERLLKRHPIVNWDKNQWPEPNPRSQSAFNAEKEKIMAIEKKIRKDLVGKTITVTKGFKNPFISIAQEVIYYPWEAKWGDSKLGVLIGGEWYYILMEKYQDLRMFQKIQIL